MPETVLRMLAEWALRATLLAAVVGALLGMLRVKNASLRSAAWTLVVVGALLMPAFSFLAPRFSIAVPAWLNEPSPSDQGAPPATTVEETGPGLGPQPSPSHSPVSSATPLAPRPDWRRIAGSVLVGVWLAVALYLLAKLLVGLWLSQRLVRSSHEVRQGVRESSQVAVPVTVGLLRQVVLLPLDWRKWDERRLEAVLAHEEAHVRRYDPLRQAIAGLYRSLCWFHPLSWWLYARLASLAEAVGDDAALGTIKDRGFYAEVLLEFLARAPRRVRWEGVTLAGKAKAMKRMERILDSRRKLSGSLARSVSVAVILAALPLIYIAASARPVWAVPQTIAISAPALIPQISISAAAPQGPVPRSPKVAAVSRQAAAPPATSTMVAAQPAGMSDDEPWALIVSDETDSYPVHILEQKGDNWGVLVHFAGLSKGLKSRDFVAGFEFVSAFQFHAWREAAMVKVRVEAEFLKLRPDTSRGAGHFNTDGRLEPVGLYSITSEDSPLSVSDGAKYGMPMLRFQVVKKGYACPTAEEIANLTTSLRAEGLQPQETTCVWVLRNVSRRKIVEVVTGYLSSGSASPKFQRSYDGAVDPGGTTRAGEVAFRQLGRAAGGRLAILATVFDDGTFDGDSSTGMKESARRAGRTFAMAQFVPYMRELLLRFDEEEPKLLDEAKARMRSMPDADPELEGKEIARLKAQDPEEVRQWIRSGMRDAKSNVAERLSVYESIRLSPFRHDSFHDYWSNEISRPPFADR